MDVVVKTIQKYMGLPESVMTDDADLYLDLGADSLTLNEIVSAIEAEYEIEEVPLEEMKQVKTIGDMKALVKKLAAYCRS